MKSPQVGPREVVYKNKYQQIYRVSAQFENFKKEFFVNDYGRRVGLLIVKSEEVLLVRQYRFLVNELALEIPGGKIDPDETPEDGALREGLEETCLACRNLKPLLYFHPGLDTFDNPTFLFYTKEFEEVPTQTFHEHEVSAKVWIPLEKAVEMIFKKEIVDSLTICALLAFHTLKQQPALEKKKQS